MPKNRTPIKQSARPKFGLNEGAYIRESALRGFLEPIVIARIRYEPSINAYVYKWLRTENLGWHFIKPEGGNPALKTFNPIPDKNLAPFEVREEELIDVCEALDIQIRFLEAELASAQSEFVRVCNSVEDELAPSNVPDVVNKFVVLPQIPRYAVNEVVYLIETAQTVGRLEAMRVDEIEFDSALQKWVYTFVFQQKPGDNMTVGDRIDLKESVVVRKTEDDLVSVCEAIPLRVDYLTSALTKSRNLRDGNCP